MHVLQVVLNWVSRALGLELRFDTMGAFLFTVVVIFPLGAMWLLFRLARKHRRPVAWVAALPLVWWVIPIGSFALQGPLGLKALPLLGIALGGAGFVGLFVLVGGNEEIGESERALREVTAAQRDARKE